LKTYWHEWDKLIDAENIPEEVARQVRDKMVDLLIGKLLPNL